MSGDLEKATSHMETFHHLSRHGKWHTDSGDNLHDIACEHLRRVYTSIAEQVHAECIIYILAACKNN